MNKLYTAQEIADKLQIKKTTVYELIKRGELYSSKVGKQLRISEQQLKQYLERTGSGNTVPAQGIQGNVAPLDSVSGNLQVPELPPESSLLKRDYLLHSSGLILCGQFSPALELLVSHMSIHPLGIPVLQSFMNSYNSLYSLYFKKAHIACASLDPEHIRSLVPGTQLSLLCLYEYSIGLYVSAGNPLNLKDLKDLLRRDIKIANREKGSTPRIYLDQFLFLKNFHQLWYPDIIRNWYLIFPQLQQLPHTRPTPHWEKNMPHTSPGFWILFHWKPFLCIWSWKQNLFPNLAFLRFWKSYGLKISAPFFRDRLDMM